MKRLRVFSRTSVVGSLYVLVVVLFESSHTLLLWDVDRLPFTIVSALCLDLETQRDPFYCTALSKVNNYWL